MVLLHNNNVVAHLILWTMVKMHVVMKFCQ